MNKILLAIGVIAALFVAYFLLTSNPPQNAAISGSLPEQAEDKVEPQVAAVATSLISPSPDNAAVFFLEPGHGTTVSSPVTVKFGITGMTVVPAGDNAKHSGHHHLLINMDGLPAMDQPLPATDQLIHFGGGQTETSLDLAPGEHSLQLLLGNHLHIPHDPPVVSRKITITVE